MSRRRQPKSWTSGNGQAFTRTIDADGRIATHTLGADTRTIAYDPASRITGMTHNDATLNQTFGYDNRDRVTSWVANTTNQGYWYDANGNRTSLQIGTNTYTNTIAANSNRLTSINGPTAKSYTYDAAGNLTVAGTVNVTYGGDGRPATLGYSWVTTASNGLGQRVQLPGVNGGMSNILTFDESGQILGEYLAQSSAAQTETVYLGSIPVALLRPPQIVLDSDSTGSLVTITGTWPLSTSGAGYAGNLGYRTHAAGSGSSSVRWGFWYSGSTPVAGSYNVFVRWVAGADRATNATYTITSTGGTAIVTANQQLSDGEWVPLGTYSFAQNQAHGVVLTDQANGLVVADAIKYENANIPFYTYYVHPDHLNTPRVVTDSANQIRWRWDTADPFGSLAPTDVIGGVTFKMNDRFPGQYGETYPSTGFAYNYYRDYSPDIGRYVQSDPIGLRGGINPYVYANNAPTMYTDPLGLEPGDLVQRGYAKPARQVCPGDDAIQSVCPECYLLGAGRLLYAGLAKSIPALASATEESVLAQAAYANAARNSLKDLFRGPLAPVLSGVRQPTFAESMAKYGGDASKVIEAAARTNAGANAAGATGVALGAAAGAGSCGCQK